MKSFLLAAAVAAGIACFANPADAQWLARRRAYAADTYPTYSSSYPTYQAVWGSPAVSGSSSYYLPTYTSSAPSYSGGAVTDWYTPSYSVGSYSTGGAYSSPFYSGYPRGYTYPSYRTNTMSYYYPNVVSFGGSGLRW